MRNRLSKSNALNGFDVIVDPLTTKRLIIASSIIGGSTILAAIIKAIGKGSK